jgi:hypothetical protein
LGAAGEVANFVVGQSLPGGKKIGVGLILDGLAQAAAWFGEHEVVVDLAAQWRGMTPEQLLVVVPGITGQRNPYQCVRPILQGCFGHLGEIEAMKNWQVAIAG